MADQPAGVAPLQNPATDPCRDEQTVPGAPARGGLGALGHPYSRFYSPGEDTHHQSRREDGIQSRAVVGGLGLEDSGESVCPHVLGARAVGQGEVEPAEEQGPACLTGTQPLGVPDIGQVLVVRPDNYGLLGPLQPVAPLREGGVDSQELPIAHVVVRLCR